MIYHFVSLCSHLYKAPTHTVRTKSGVWPTLLSCATSFAPFTTGFFLPRLGSVVFLTSFSLISTFCNVGFHRSNSFTAHEQFSMKVLTLQSSSSGSSLRPSKHRSCNTRLLLLQKGSSSKRDFNKFTQNTHAISDVGTQSSLQ